jgi:hypothetical protein
MAPMGEHDDAWVASVASYVRLALGNRATPVTPQDVARVRAATAARTKPWTYPELAAAVPVPLRPQPTWKATASHNAAKARGAFDFSGWTSVEPQAAGMWFQVELPEPATLAEVEFESPAMRVVRQGVAANAASNSLPGPRPPEPLTYPRGYRVELSTDGTTWSTAAEGAGGSVVTSVPFKPTRARFVRVTQTATPDGSPATPPGTLWAIQQLRLWTVPGTR